MKSIRHTFESRLNIVSQALNGRPLMHLEKIYNTSSREIRMWIRKYELHGESSLHPANGNNISLEEKERIVQDVLVNEKGLSLAKAAINHNVSYSALWRWVKIVKQNGLEGLKLPSSPKARPKNLPVMARPKKKKPTTELEKLQFEVYKLRAENELLKKVKALVEEREARERMTGLKSSKN